MSELQAQIGDLAKKFTTFHTQSKEITGKKKQIEDELKNLLEENKVKDLVFSNHKITFSSTVRKSTPKVSEVLEIIHKKVIEYCPENSDKIMEEIGEIIEEQKKETVVRVLRVSEKN
jgi:predicted transcriptional regulator